MKAKQEELDAVKVNFTKVESQLARQELVVLTGSNFTHRQYLYLEGEMVPKVVINPLGPAWLDFVKVSVLPSLAFLIFKLCRLRQVF